MANRRISQLSELAAPPASGDYLPIVDISEPADADKNKRITVDKFFSRLPLPPVNTVNLVYSGSTLTEVSYPSGVPYDFVALSYTNDDVTQIDYKDGGSAGVLIARYALTYSGGTLTSVVRTV